MRRMTFVLAMLALLMLPAPASAHEAEWSPGPMKSDGISSPAIECHVVGEYGGHKYTWRYRMVGDGDEPNEDAWLVSFCETAGRTDVKRWFLVREGLDIPDSAIRNLTGR